MLTAKEIVLMPHMGGYELIVLLAVAVVEAVLEDPAFLEFAALCIPYSPGTRRILDSPDILSHVSESCKLTKPYSRIYHRAKGNQADKSCRRKQTQTDNQGIFQRLQIRIVQTCVYNIQEYGRSGSRLVQKIFNRRELWL